MRRAAILRLVFVAILGAMTTGLKCAEGPLDRANGPSTTTRSLSGTWEGPIVTLVMQVVLSDAAGTITGTGVMTQNGTPFALAITGTRTGSSFSLNVNEADHEPFTYSGTIQGSGTTMVGVANGSGFLNQSITLTKQ